MIDSLFPIESLIWYKNRGERLGILSKIGNILQWWRGAIWYETHAGIAFHWNLTTMPNFCRG